MNLKDKILALAVANAIVAVASDNVPEGIFVKKLSIGEREIYAKKIDKAMKKSKENAMNALAFCLVACDEHGEPIFSEDDIDDVNKLPSDLVLDVLDTFNQINGFSQKSQKAVDTAEKN